MSFIRSFFALPREYGPARLASFAVAGFALAAVTLPSAIDPDAGIPRMSALGEASGRLESIDARKNGVRFRLAGRTESFEYPANGRGYGIVESALRTAGPRNVAVLFDPKARLPAAGAGSCHDVWQVAIDGQIVRSFREVSDGWRLNNRFALGICVFFLSSGVYFAVLAIRARRLRVFR